MIKKKQLEEALGAEILRMDAILIMLSNWDRSPNLTAHEIVNLQNILKLARAKNKYITKEEREEICMNHLERKNEE